LGGFPMSSSARGPAFDASCIFNQMSSTRAAPTPPSKTAGFVRIEEDDDEEALIKSLEAVHDSGMSVMCSWLTCIGIACAFIALSGPLSQLPQAAAPVPLLLDLLPLLPAALTALGAALLIRRKNFAQIIAASNGDMQHVKVAKLITPAAAISVGPVVAGGSTLSLARFLLGLPAISYQPVVAGVLVTFFAVLALWGTKLDQLLRESVGTGMLASRMALKAVPVAVPLTLGVLVFISAVAVPMLLGTLLELAQPVSFAAGGLLSSLHTQYVAQSTALYAQLDAELAASLETLRRSLRRM